MSMTWTDIADGTIAAGKPLKTDSVMKALRNNDEANSDKPIYLRVDVTNTPATTYGAAVATISAYVRKDAKQLRTRAAMWAVSGTVTGKFRVQKLTAPSGSVEVEASSTATARGVPAGSADKTWQFTDLTNVSGDDLRGQDIKIELFLKHSAGAVSCDVETTLGWPASRYSVS